MSGLTTSGLSSSAQLHGAILVSTIVPWGNFYVITFPLNNTTSCLISVIASMAQQHFFSFCSSNL
jgi:hypothetical protein